MCRWSAEIRVREVRGGRTSPAVAHPTLGCKFVTRWQRRHGQSMCTYGNVAAYRFLDLPRSRYCRGGRRGCVPPLSVSPAGCFCHACGGVRRFVALGPAVSGVRRHHDRLPPATRPRNLKDLSATMPRWWAHPFRGSGECMVDANGRQCGTCSMCWTGSNVKCKPKRLIFGAFARQAWLKHGHASCRAEGSSDRRQGRVWIPAARLTRGACRWGSRRSRWLFLFPHDSCLPW